MLILEGAIKSVLVASSTVDLTSDILSCVNRLPNPFMGLFPEGKFTNLLRRLFGADISQQILGRLGLTGLAAF